MHFQHPGFLYFLFALIIPIIVHLFQLRKFQKIPFTNVAFLKKVVMQTRKSSQLKKWLTLLARLLALTCIIFAFAQPYLPGETSVSAEKETIIYLDNSFSMGLDGKRGPLLKRSVQELLENLPVESDFTLLTNDEIFRNSSVEELKKELLNLDFSASSPSLKIIFLRAKNEFSKNSASEKEFIAISDFQENSFDPEIISAEKINFNLLQVQPVNNNNVSIDSVFISEKNMDKINLSVQLSFTGKKPESVPVSLYNGEELLAKTGANFDTEKTIVIPLAITLDEQEIKGKIQLEDNGLAYDNSFYFSIAKREKIKVVALNHSPDTFLQRIFSSEEFDFQSFEKGNFDYNKIASAHTVILNELEEIPAGLIAILSKVVENGGHVVIIPASEINESDYQKLSNALRSPVLLQKTQQEKSIIEIAFGNPLFQHVFENKVSNFQYPNVKTSFGIQGAAQPILSYADGSAFLAQNGNVFVFSAALNSQNSNFQQSPLIVPTFYNIALQSLKQPQLYQLIGEKSIFEIPVMLQKDEILRIKNEESAFIPMQRSTGESVEITTENLPNEAGIYTIYNGDIPIRNIAFNFTRNESELQYANLEQYTGKDVPTDISDFFTQQREMSEIQELWKWFVIFALFFLLIEVLLLKFLK
ncbi:MAG TPA: BatA domain-containing protein [Flavobacteriaceae bacterium]|nr:BatA domain-containing protein [Flavobacteriaceae bacterium]